MSASLILIPNSLGSNDPDTFLSPYVRERIISITCFIVEDLRNARRYLKSLDKTISIDDLTFFELNKHTNSNDLSSFLEPALTGIDTGIISEAGLPGIADPGAQVVNLAHKRGITVVPLTGPSSIFLSLMSSGFSGQHFRFCGYLPVKSQERIQQLKTLEKKVIASGETQIFIETPYRNNAMLEDIIKACDPSTNLCIASDITTKTEFIQTLNLGAWAKKRPDLHKRPTVFLLGK